METTNSNNHPSEDDKLHFFLPTQWDTPEYNWNDTWRAKCEGRLDEENRRFLNKVLVGTLLDPDLLKRVFLFRNRMNNALSPGLEPFIEMLELGMPFKGLKKKA